MPIFWMPSHCHGPLKGWISRTTLCIPWVGEAFARPLPLPSGTVWLRQTSLMPQKKQTLNGLSILVVWAKPKNDGGSPVIDYTVIYREVGQGPWVILNDPVSPDRRAVIGGLMPGATYEFRVAAVNAHGEGAWSRPVKATIA